MTEEPEEHQGAIVREAILQRFREEVNEANVLLEWAVSMGKELKPELIGRIKTGADLLVHAEVSTTERAAFETAYNELCRITSPITWESLQATSSRYGEKSWLAPVRRLRGQGLSRSRRWSRTLWLWTSLLLILILVGENLREYLDTFSPVDEESQGAGTVMAFSRLTFWFSKVVPFLYGALGACAFLLRACHKYIHERSFDPRRLPEYYNRILLGFLAGGTILLFISPETAPQKVSASALAFLAGYSTDFLYTTIERVAAALLPKRVAGAEAPSTERAGPKGATERPTPHGG